MDTAAATSATLDRDVCYRALAAKDARFDGTFFVGVTTTGIYCRPVCPARTPSPSRCRYFASAAGAEQDGFRACFRCRPELAPGHLVPEGERSRVVASAVARIEEGALNEGSLDELAREVGVTSRHLRRAMQGELGVSPIDLAQSHRLALAKRLLHDTRLSMTEVAHASGFASLRRFNAAFRARFGCAPSALRRSPSVAGDTIRLVLAYREPFAWPELLGFLRARATPGVELVTEQAYARTARIGAHVGRVMVSLASERRALSAEVSTSLAPVLMPLVLRLRHLFDLDAHPAAITEHLGRDPRLRKLARARPGLRVPGAFDGFEVSVRAVLGQQVSVAAATTMAGRLAERFGEAMPRVEASPSSSPTTLFPTPERLARASGDEIAKIGLVGARAKCLFELARAVTEGRLRLDGHGHAEATYAALLAVPGIGPWTASYVAMRAFRAPDAFPEGDLVLRRVLGGVSAREALASAERWRPWRAYAAMHLWASLTGEP